MPSRLLLFTMHMHRRPRVIAYHEGRISVRLRIAHKCDMLLSIKYV